MNSVALELALKVLWRRPIFTAISLFGVVITLVTLLVGAAMVDQLIGTQYPEPERARLLGVNRMRMSGENTTVTGDPGYAFLDKYVRTLPSAELVSIVTDQWETVAYAGETEAPIYLKHTDGAFWRMMRMRFLEGDPLTSEDDANGRRVAVINAASCMRLYGGPPCAGKSLELDGRSFRVVGVVENVSFTSSFAFADVWVTHGSSASSAYRSRFVGGCSGMILARSTADLPRIQGELASRIPEIPLPDPATYKTLTVAAESRFESISREMLSSDESSSHPGLFAGLLIGAAILFMLLPAVNLANLNMSRTLERTPEIGVRKAFGASSHSMVLQFLIENLVLTLIGGAISVAAATAVLRLINRTGWLPYSQLAVDGSVLSLGVAMALLFGLMSGVYPAWRMARLHPAEALRGRVA